jgi:hypothetical protein
MKWLELNQRTPEEQYMNLAGEVQSRLVEARSKMNPVQQRLKDPVSHMLEMGYPIRGQELHTISNSSNPLLNGMTKGVAPIPEAIKELYHGGSFTPGSQINRKLYTALDPKMAETYVEMAADRFGGDQRLTKMFADINSAAPQQVVDELAKIHGIDNIYTPAAVFDDNLHDPALVDALIKSLKSKGYDHTVLPDVPYGYGRGGAPAMDETAYVLFPGVKTFK